MKLKMNRHIYNRRALVKTAGVFSEAANFIITTEGDYFIVEVSSGENSETTKRIAAEFANYVIYFMKG